MELTKLIDNKTLSEDCNMVTCKVFTDEDTGEVKKIVCEYVPKDCTSKGIKFRSQC